ncbi:MAG: BLUF domain-containing protein [Hylemonella sp.]|uniref:BLUF domain-containing protein n=1 Tax=Hylemonella sp. TaxID=2066020 RepID=UPI0022BC84C7|nr:BLUF domain-containing protein [Hylemonella sp.]MCZ8253176.1 BLUF domain-containing protein [Hylemonella sp.]
MPYQLIYSSVSSTPMQSEDLQDILKRAQDNNARQGITGALVYVDGFFLQILEGSMESVCRLMEKIAGDIRHETVTVLQAGEVADASFSDWTMAYVSATPEQIAEWAGLKTPLALPELFEQVRQDRQRAMQLAKSIMSVLLGELVQNGKAP